MSESLEALQNIVKFFVKKLEDEPTNLEDFETNYSQVEKSLEVLEIIKDKLVVANLIGNGKIYHTISIPKEINKLTENQYEKIKEWVDNESK